MAVLPIHKIGGGADTAELTAGTGDVLTPETFLGSGSDENQEGAIVLRGSPTYSISANGSQSLPAGHYSGGIVTQSIPTMGAQSVGPGAQMITLSTAGKYMTGNITIRTTYNLIPSLIKKGVTVGGVVGNFEGYVITDPRTLYKYGTFNGIQTITAFKYNLSGEVGTVSLERDNINVTVSANYKQTAIVFDSPINFDQLSTLTVRYDARLIQSGEGSTTLDVSVYRNKVTNYVWSSSGFNTGLGGSPLANAYSFGTGGDLTASVSGVTGNAYVYLMFTGPGAIYNIKMVTTN